MLCTAPQSTQPEKPVAVPPSFPIPTPFMAPPYKSPTKLLQAPAISASESVKLPQAPPSFRRLQLRGSAMAGTGRRSSVAASTALPLLLAAVALATAVPASAAGVQFRVGGSMGWRVPAGDAESYNQWAERNRFKIGDSLLFAYPAGRDSVLLVTKEGYDGCDTASPPAASLGGDGSTVFTFDRSGPFFFISGAGDNCRKGEKMVVVVLADRSNRSSPMAAPPSTPPAAPPASGTPAPEPGTTPAPPPSETSASPPPPPAPAVQIVPTTSPPEGPAAPNGAAAATTAAGFFVVLVTTAAFLL